MGKKIWFSVRPTALIRETVVVTFQYVRPLVHLSTPVSITNT